MKIIKKFCTYYKPYLGTFIADMVCAVLFSACNMVYPLITREMLDDFIPNGKLNLLFIWAGILLLVYVAKFFFNYFITYFGHVVGVNMQSDMRKEVFDHLESLPLRYFDDNKTGTIMSKIINDLQDVSELAHHGPEDLFLSVVMLVGSFIIMASICLPLTLIIYALIPFMAFFAAKMQTRMESAFTEQRVKIGEVNATLENSVAGIRVSKAYTNRKREFELFDNGNRQFVKAKVKAYRAMADFHCGSTLMIDIIRLVMYAAGGVFVFNGSISIADFTAFILYISLVISPVEMLVGFAEQYQSGMSGFRRFVEIIEQPKEKDNEGSVVLTDVKGEIEFKEVTFSYVDGQKVLDGVSFKAEAGKKLALVGSSGGGKTTICNLIPRFYEIGGGEITIDGKDVRGLTLESLRRNIGIVSQDVFLFDSTVFDNIAYGNTEASREEVIEAAKLANIHDFIMSLPNGYETEVGERGVKLSGGQKQRISIARV
ncbi:MAG: ABC transporter ATP-binding protein, partial [Firmicutes bacterium]|nr:ABC transporter ATP-binding protein [Candidatus Colimorpha enterica]